VLVHIHSYCESHLALGPQVEHSYHTVLATSPGSLGLQRKTGFLIDRISYKHHLWIKKKKPGASKLRQEIGGGTLAERERILGNRERVKIRLGSVEEVRSMGAEQR
jgi:hypothetical protein